MENGAVELIQDLIPARMLNEFVYCPRLFYLEWVEGQFEDNTDTLQGSFIHRNVDQEKGDPNSAEEGEKIHATSLLLSAPEAGIIARMDLIEGEGKILIPVDYKKSSLPRNGVEVWDTDKIQLCAQVIVLRENGYICNEGIVYYAGSRKRVSIPIDDQLVTFTMEKLAEARRVSGQGFPPPPLVESPRCPRCSLVGICLPDEVFYLENQSEFEAKEEPEVRRLYPARDDSLPVLVDKQGVFIGKSGDEIVIKEKNTEIERIRLFDTSSLSVFGNVQVSTQLIQELCQREIPVCYYSWGGWFRGITNGLFHKNVELQKLQYAAALDDKKCLSLAKSFVKGKIKNCRTLIRRNSSGDAADVLKGLKDSIDSVDGVESIESLLGVEGMGASRYFSAFPGMIKQDDANDSFNFDFSKRNRRPPKNPVNSLLSFAYAILLREIMVTLLKVGFDPCMGFYHKIRYGKPSLALDMMEEFRPIICDSAVIMAINNGEISADDFIRRAGAVSLKDTGRKKFVEAFYRRLDCLVTHPVFGYKLSYRRVLELQARLLSRYLYGEIKEYPAFITR